MKNAIKQSDEISKKKAYEVYTIACSAFELEKKYTPKTVPVLKITLKTLSREIYHKYI